MCRLQHSGPMMMGQVPLQSVRPIGQGMGHHPMPMNMLHRSMSVGSATNLLPPVTLGSPASSPSPPPPVKRLSEDSNSEAKQSSQTLPTCGSSANLLEVGRESPVGPIGLVLRKSPSLAELISAQLISNQ